MEKVILQEIKIIGNRCEYKYTIPDSLSKYIVDKSDSLFVELPEGYDLTEVPEALLAVSFVGSMMCATMLLNIEIEVPQLDKTFYESIPNIAAAYKKMFPYANLCFDIHADQLVDCTFEPTNKTSVFFTGGLDATSALIEHIEKKPLLVNIWGGDLLLTDTDANKALHEYFTKLTKQIGNEYVILKSNCRRYFNENLLEEVLNTIIKPEHNHGWWASIAHILSMESVVAPLLFINKINIHYVGSGYSSTSNGFDANNLDMNRAIKYSSSGFVLVDSDKDRPDKAKKIIDYCRQENVKVDIKVCWHSTASINCSRCEKCYRTMLNILINHGDPNDYGFSIDSAGYRQMHRFALYHEVNIAFWEANRQMFLVEADYWRKNKDMSWILDIDFNNSRRLAMYRYYRKVYNLLSRIKHKCIG